MAFAPFSLLAHAFGQTYTLPVPLWLFLFGSGTAVAVSFAVIGLMTDVRPPGKYTSTEKGLGSVGESGRFLGVLFLAITVITGLAGTQDSQNSFTVIFFWVIFLLGFTYLVAILGNLWKIVNPFIALIDGIESIVGRKLRPLTNYPQWLGYWPALLGYYWLIWVEIIGGGFGASPRNLSLIIIGYAVFTLIAAVSFGKESWFKYGEMFSVYFRLVSKISPIRIKGGTYSLRRPLDGLISSQKANFSLLLFILFMLASTGFDGLKETVVFGRLVGMLPSGLAENYYFTGGIGLALSLLVLLAIYILFIMLMKVFVSTTLSVRDLSFRFSFSLVPIAAAYHFAHYFTMLLITGQGIIPKISDPFGSGLNLFGTAGYIPNIGFLSASAVWYIELALIITGHIAAVYIAHMEALKLFGNRHDALISQIPITILMVLYTAGSLWIIAQPIAI